jgi:hypothetical protein
VIAPAWALVAIGAWFAASFSAVGLWLALREWSLRRARRRRPDADHLYD